MVNKVGSSKPGKQRKRHFQAPKHKVHKQFTAPIAGATPAETAYPFLRRAPVRRGDRVEIDRGQGEPRYADKDTKVRFVQGKVARVDYKRHLVYIEDLKMRKRGNKVADRPIDPRNISIVAFDTSDKRRKAWLEKMNARGEA